jgi:hypothetical protein
MMLNLASLLGGGLLSKAGEAAQRKAAQAAYRIYRKAFQGQKLAGKVVSIPDWKDLTQNEQERIIGAAGDILEEEMK